MVDDGWIAANCHNGGVVRVGYPRGERGEQLQPEIVSFRKALNLKPFAFSFWIRFWNNFYIEHALASIAPPSEGPLLPARTLARTRPAASAGRIASHANLCSLGRSADHAGTKRGPTRIVRPGCGRHSTIFEALFTTEQTLPFFPGSVASELWRSI